MTFKECYAVLGLQPGATLTDVKQAYRRLAFSLHPDLNPDIPDAPRRFQILNEAYVQLTNAPADRARARASAGGDARAHTKAGKAYDKASKEEGAATGGASAKGSRSGTFASKERSREDVLKDILNDPFARRVFEDIYSHIRKDDPKGRKNAEKDGDIDGSGSRLRPSVPPLAQITPVSGMLGKIKGWLKKQIDDEQIVRLPRESLVPGARVRLEIQHGFAEEPQVLEITLPPEFVPGRAMRLKGMGRRIGSMRGDLYVRIEPA